MGDLFLWVEEFLTGEIHLSYRILFIIQTHSDFPDMAQNVP